VLHGDLANTPLDGVLRRLADDQATGRLTLSESADSSQGSSAQIYVAKGEIYAGWLAETDADPVVAADARLQLRLLAEEALNEDAWNDAVAAQDELFDWSIGELLVELGHLERNVLERVATEELLEAAAQAYGWSFGGYRFRRRERTRNRAGRTYRVDDLLEAVSQRRAERDRLEVPADAVPTLGDGALEAAGFEAAVHGLVDGVRAVTDIEVASGCTGLEVAAILRSLADRGHVILPEPAAAEAIHDDEPVAADDDDPVSRWSALLDAALPPPAPKKEAHSTVEKVRSDQPSRPVERLDPETAERRARLRARAAEELLAAQAEADALREAKIALSAEAVQTSELSVVELLTVIEKSIESSEPVDAVESTDVVGLDDFLAEVVEALDEDPFEAAVESVEAAVEPVEAAVESVDAPVESVEAAVEPVEAAVESVESAVEEAAVESVEVAVDLADEPVADEPVADELVAGDPVTEELVAEELLVAELPLAAAPAEALSTEVAEPSDESEIPATEPAEPMSDQDAAADNTDAQITLEPVEEHDPALAAALLRELSNLGLDDEPEPVAAAPRIARAPAHRAAATAGRKKRGIFGR
jgi:hypothetical protein